MKLSFYFSRILHNKVKVLFIIFTVLLPLTEVIQIIIDVFYWHLSKYNANYVTFLAGYRGKIGYQIYLWVLPLYYLVIASEDTFQDQKNGYRQLMIERFGKRNYVLQKLFGSFIISFSVMALGLMVNYVFLNIVLYGGKQIIYDISREDMTPLFALAFDHPFLANICYGIILSVITGIVGTFGTAIALVISNRKVAYVIVLMLWTFIIHFEKYNILEIIQPFNSYTLKYIVLTFCLFALLYISITAIFAGWVMKHDEV